MVKQGNLLSEPVLYYEELEEKKVVKAKKAVKSKPKVRVNKKMSKRKTLSEKNPAVYFNMLFGTIKSTLNVRSHFDNILKKINKQPKKAKKVTKAQKQEIQEQRKRGILGIGLLLVIVSIIYSTTVVREFVDSAASLVALAPQVIFAGVILVKAFSKLYK